VGRRLRRAGVRARVVQLKIKLADHTLVTRRCTLADPTDDGQTLYREALALLARYDLRQRVRLTGVAGQELISEGAQLSLLGEAPTRTARLNATLDRIADKFGGRAIRPADSHRPPPTRTTTRGRCASCAGQTRRPRADHSAARGGAGGAGSAGAPWPVMSRALYLNMAYRQTQLRSTEIRLRNPTR
jgi:hypothetical protein